MRPSLVVELDEMLRRHVAQEVGCVRFVPASFLSVGFRMIERMFDDNENESSDVEPLAVLDRRVAASNEGLLEVIDEVARLDTDDVWLRYGAGSVTELLAGRYGVSTRTARDWQRVASALEALPEVRRVFAAGCLSWEQLREVTRIATAESDGHGAVAGQEMTTAEIRGVRLAPTREAVNEAQFRRSVRWFFHETRPEFEMTVRCPDAEGAVIASALQRRANQAGKDPVSGVYEPFESRCADALWQIASESLAGEADADRATVLVTVDLDQLVGRQPGGRVVHGRSLLPETIERLVCDARLQLAVEDRHGTVVGVGRTMRTPPAGMRRVVLARDGGCRFPRCRRTRWVHVHHLVHWVDGGPTDLDNLITLCVFHHRLIHEGGWAASGDPNREVTWITGHGWIHHPRPPTPDDEFHRRMLNSLPDIQPPHRPRHAGLPPP